MNRQPDAAASVFGQGSDGDHTPGADRDADRNAGLSHSFVARLIATAAATLMGPDKRFSRREFRSHRCRRSRPESRIFRLVVGLLVGLPPLLRREFVDPALLDVLPGLGIVVLGVLARRRSSRRRRGRRLADRFDGDGALRRATLRSVQCESRRDWRSSGRMRHPHREIHLPDFAAPVARGVRRRLGGVGTGCQRQRPSFHHCRDQQAEVPSRAVRLTFEIVMAIAGTMLTPPHQAPASAVVFET